MVFARGMAHPFPLPEGQGSQGKRARCPSRAWIPTRQEPCSRTTGTTSSTTVTSNGWSTMASTLFASPSATFTSSLGHPNESVRALIKDTDYERYAPIYAGAFSRIQRAIEFTASRNVGVLVDLHGAPGGQNADAHCGVSDGKAALWDSPANQQKTIEILKAMASEYARFENVVGLELINEPKNSGSLSSFYDQAITQVRSVSPEVAALPLYIGDAWDTNYYTGFVGQRASASNFLVTDHHLYRCFTAQDLATRVEDFARKLNPGTSPLPTNSDGAGETAVWLKDMSNRCGGSLVVGEWSAALNPASLQYLSTEEQQRAAKAEYAFNEWKSFDKFCAGYFFWTLKKEGAPDTGLGLLLGCRARSPPAASGPAPRTTQSGGPYEHWRFSDGYSLAWTDSVEFLKANESNEIGFTGQWQKTRTAAHAQAKGQGSTMIWEFEHGYSQGLAGFKSALYR
ncbi:hypothetical protein L1887_58076 [Cichorium endivia]|nr:hypothetical protein L1887_58076 [Cichorium endivia]